MGYFISSSLHAALNNLIVVLSAIGQTTTQRRGRRWEYKDGDGGVYKRLNLPRALPVNLQYNVDAVSELLLYRLTAGAIEVSKYLRPLKKAIGVPDGFKF